MARKKATAKRTRTQNRGEKSELTKASELEEAESLQSDEEIKLKEKKRQEKQVYIIVFWMLFAILFTIFFVYFFRNAGTFIYDGMKFQRVNMNGLILYKTVLQFTRQDGTFKFELYLRNNPRDLEKIPSNATIVLRRGGFVSFEPRISNCYGSNIAANELGTFLSALGMLVKGATTDKNLSEEQSLPFKTCDDAVNLTVITLESSNKSSIEQKGNCYVLKIADCNAIGVAEKFIFETALQMFNRSKEEINSNNTK